MSVVQVIKAVVRWTLNILVAAITVAIIVTMWPAVLIMALIVGCLYLYDWACS